GLAGRVRRALWHSNLYRHLRSRWLGAGTDQPGPPRHQTEGRVNRVPPEQVTENLVALTRASGASQAVFVVLPSAVPMANPAYVAALREASLQVPGGRFLDLNQAWLRDAASERLALFLPDDPIHPNASGSERIARALAGELDPARRD